MHPAGEMIMDRPQSAPPSEEMRLVRAILDDEPDAFETLVALHAAPLASIARRFLKDPNDLDDVLQETFLRGYQNLRRYRGEASLRTWLARIAINICRDRGRGFWRRSVVLGTPAETVDAQRCQASGSDGAVLHEAIRAAVARLPDTLREPFVLHAYEEMSGVEIASALGLNERTVWNRIYAARKQLQQRLGDILERQ